MRKPKQPGTQKRLEEKVPAGGRAWQRVRQFAIERGMPLPAEPPEDETDSAATSKRAPQGITTQSTKRAKASKRSGAKKQR